MTHLLIMAKNGIRQLEDFLKGSDEYERQKITSNVTSLAATAIPEPLFVSGAVDALDNNRLHFTVVGQKLSAKAEYTPAHGAKVEVHSNAAIRSIQITSAPITTSDVIGHAGTGDLQYVLKFDWGGVVVSRHNGSESDLNKWLEHFSDLLAKRA